MIFTALEGYKLQYRSSHNWYIGNTKYSFSKCCAQIVEVMLELWRMPKKDPRCRNTMCPEKYTSRGRVNNQVENLPAPSKSRRLQSYCDQVHRDTPDAHKTDKTVLWVQPPILRVFLALRKPCRRRQHCRLLILVIHAPASTTACACTHRRRRRFERHLVNGNATTVYSVKTHRIVTRYST